ncbi:MAG: MFS transporter [Cytophagales bacterium]|nr:MFS transporter [Cytophagales bacterium]
MEKNSPKIVNAWCMYDWAVSVYNLVITSSIFPVYYANVAVNSTGGDMIDFLGINIKNSVLYSYALSFSFLLIVLLNPILTSLADSSGRKKAFMQFFCWLGGLSCITLYFFETSTISLSIIMFVLAGLGFGGSWVFYSSYLPQIATPDRFDAISAKGFTLGYIGSVLLLIFNLTMLLQPSWYGNISPGLASRLSFLSVGVWWILFAQYTFYHLPKDIPNATMGKQWMQNSINDLSKVARRIWALPQLKIFLISFFFYNTGVLTVMYVATIFAEKELHLPSSNLIATVLILQIIAIAGAYIFAAISKKWGNIASLMIQICIWIGICGGGYFVTNGLEFYILAIAVGLVMGGIQSLSRATFSKLLPEGISDTASFFSFYEILYNLSIVLGTFMYGFIEQITGSARNSIVVLGVFFIISLFTIYKIKIPKNIVTNPSLI